MTPPRPVDPQSAPRDIPAMPEPDREREGDDLHWPDVPINEVPDAEREALLNQAGPVGESARLAWNAYQEREGAAPGGEDASAVARERTRLSEMGQAPPEDAQAVKAQAAVGPRVTTPTTEAVEAGTHGPGASGAGEGASGMPGASGASDAGSSYSRADADQRAAQRGLEVRDYGTSGDWRVYDPATGRQVAKSKLDEPVSK